MCVDPPLPFSWKADAVQELFKPPSEQQQNVPPLPALLPFPVTLGKFYVVQPADPEDEEEADTVRAPFWLVLVHSMGSDDLKVDGVEHVRVHYLTMEERKKPSRKQAKDAVQVRIDFLTGDNEKKMDYLHDIEEEQHVFFASAYYWSENATEVIPVSIIQCAVEMKAITSRLAKDQNGKKCYYKVTEGIKAKNVHKVANAARRFAGNALWRRVD